MGLMGLLFSFSLHFFHILAWPLLALVYPLCASIQAIEANSNLDTRKLITYWVCLSLILLFDRAFDWLPHWPYVKLIIVGCLVIPRFDGSFYIYNRLVRPSLSINPRIVLNWFIKMLEIISRACNPPVETKKDVKETEPQALENPFAFKGSVEWPKVEEKDIVAEQRKEKNELSSAADEFDRVKSKEQAVELNVSSANSALALDSKTSQALWTCVLCKVNCTGKINLISHFQGKPHSKALKSLKAKPTATFYFEPWTCQVCKTQLKNKNDLILHLESKRHSTACETQKMETKRSVQIEGSSVRKKLGM